MTDYLFLLYSLLPGAHVSALNSPQTSLCGHKKNLASAQMSAWPPIWWWHLQSSDQSPVDKVMHWNLPCDWSLTGLYSLTSLPWKTQSCLLKANYLPRSSETVQGWHNLEPDVQSRSCTFETCFSIKAQFLSVFGCVTFLSFTTTWWVAVWTRKDIYMIHTLSWTWFLFLCLSFTLQDKSFW